MKRLLITFYLLLFTAFGLYGIDIAKNSNTGATYPNLAEAVSNASPYDTILLRDGSLLPSLGQVGGTFADHNSAVYIDKPITLLAGHDSGWLPSGTPTVIDAETNAAIDHIFKIDNTSNVTIKGTLILMNCDSSSTGGGLYITNSSDILIEDVIAKNLVSSDEGAGAFIQDSSNVKLRNVKFTTNTTGWQGGALRLYGSSKNVFQNVSFISNRSSGSSGGAVNMYLSHSNFFSNCLMSNNSASLAGGAVRMSVSHSNIFSNNTIISNTAGDEGGGYRLRSSDDNSFYDTLVGNNAANGGGYSISNSSGNLFSGVITENRATSTFGGAVEVRNSWSNVFSNMTLASNSANSSGGGLYMTGIVTSTLTGMNFFSNTSDNGSGGGGIYITKSKDITMKDSTFSKNQGYRGGAMNLYSATNITIDGFNAFKNNSSSTGGAIYFHTLTNSTITNMLIMSNSSYKGGGVYIKSLYNSTFSADVFSNTAQEFYGGAYFEYLANVTLSRLNIAKNRTLLVDAGGIVISNSQNVYYNNSSISNNYSTNNYAGLHLDKVLNSTFYELDIHNNYAVGNTGGLKVDDSKDNAFINVSIFSNSATFGGGLYVRQSTNTFFTNFSVFSNHARDDDGGGMNTYISEGMVFSNASFFDNKGFRHGGGIYLHDVNNVEMYDVSFLRNYSSYGGGFKAEGGSNYTINGFASMSNSSDKTAGGADFISVDNVSMARGMIASNTSFNSTGGMFLSNVSDSDFAAKLTHNKGKNTAALEIEYGSYVDFQGEVDNNRCHSSSTASNAVAAMYSRSTIHNSTFSNNAVGRIYMAQGIDVTSSNNRFWGYPGVDSTACYWSVNSGTIVDNIFHTNDLTNLLYDGSSTFTDVDVLNSGIGLATSISNYSGNVVYPIPLPTGAVSSLTFTDTNAEPDKLGGEIIFDGFVDEVSPSLQSYAIFLSSGGGSYDVLIAELPAIADGFQHFYTNKISALDIGGYSHLCVYASNVAGFSTSYTEIAITDNHFPTNVPTGLGFQDSDIDAGEISGPLYITNADDEANITYYVAYYSTDGLNPDFTSGYIGEYATSGTPHMHTFTANTPLNSYSHVIVFSSNSFGLSQAKVSIELNDLRPPQNSASLLSFTDTDTNRYEIGGDIIIDAAVDESDLTHYVIFYSDDGSTFIGAPLATLPATGLSHYTNDIASNVTFSPHTHFIVYTSNSAGLATSGMSCFIDDVTNSDTTAPTVTITSGPTGDITTNEAFTVELSVNEDSGYWSTNGAYLSFASTTNLTISATTTLSFYGEDTAGNVSATNSVTYTFDATAPSVTITSGPTGDITTNETFTVTLTSDEESGYFSTGGAYSSFASTTNVSISATTTLSFYGEDALGNTSPTNNVTYTITSGGSVPVNAAEGIAFNDSDGASSSIGGDVTITAASDESDLTHYVLFFSADGSTAEGAALASIAADGSASYTHTIAGGTSFTHNAFIVFTSNAAGMMSSGVSGGFSDYILTPPVDPANSVTFTDGDMDEGEIGGLIHVHFTNASETDITAGIERYMLYYSPDGISKGTAIGSIDAGGSNDYYFSLADDTSTTSGGYILVLTENSAGEMTSGVSTPIVDAKTLSSDTSLSNLEIMHYTLNETFDPNTYAYTADIDAIESYVSFRASKSFSNAVLEYKIGDEPSYSPLSNGVYHVQVPLPYDAQTNVFVRVTAENATDSQEYVLTLRSMGDKQSFKADTARGEIRTYDSVVENEAVLYYNADEGETVSVTVFDRNGARVRTLVKDEYSYGSSGKEAVWDMRSDNGVLVDNGVYYVVIKGDGWESITKVLVLR